MNTVRIALAAGILCIAVAAFHLAPDRPKADEAVQALQSATG